MFGGVSKFALAMRLTTLAAIAALGGIPKDTVVHVVVRDVSGSALTEMRALEHPLAPIAEATGGIVATVDGEVDDPSEFGR